EKLRRSARPQMERQNGQGPSGLQRHDPHRDVRDGAGIRLGLFREARAAQGQPVEIVHAAEGTPLITTPAGIFRSAANPSAARLFQSFLCSVEGQGLFVEGNRHSFHALVKAKAGRTPLSAVKLMKSDPVAVEAQSEEVKARYTKLFGV